MISKISSWNYKITLDFITIPQWKHYRPTLICINTTHVQKVGRYAKEYFHRKANSAARRMNGNSNCHGLAQVMKTKLAKLPSPGTHMFFQRWKECSVFSLSVARLLSRIAYFTVIKWKHSYLIRRFNLNVTISRIPFYRYIRRMPDVIPELHRKGLKNFRRFIKNFSNIVWKSELFKWKKPYSGKFERILNKVASNYRFFGVGFSGKLVRLNMIN